MPVRLLCYAFVVVFLASSSLIAQTQTLIRDARIVDVERGLVAPPKSLLLEGARIVDIGSGLSPTSSALTVVDAEGRYLIPGLWDSHVHIFSSVEEPNTALPLYLINGITGIRDMGALVRVEEQLELQARIASGEVLGPRLIIAGAWVDAAPGSWPGMFLADSPDEARHVVERVASEGWSAVKAYSMLDQATYSALAEAAHAFELPFIGHVPERVSLDEAILAGQHGMEHFGRVTMACSTREIEMLEALRAAMESGVELSELFSIMAARNAIILESWNQELCREILGRMVEARMHISPTLVVADFYTGTRPSSDAPRMQMTPNAVREAWGKPDFRLEAVTEEVLALAEASIALDRRTFSLAHEMGVPILASSDASFANSYLFHGFSLLDELDIYVSAGLTPREALYTATVAPPRFFGLADQDGTVAIGQRADLVLLDDNPLEGLDTLRQPRAVIVGGVVLNRERLDEMIADLRAAAN